MGVKYDLGVPRTRGDEPALTKMCVLETIVFPARAGMNRLPLLFVKHWHSVPRTRGDEPTL